MAHNLLESQFLIDQDRSTICQRMTCQAIVPPKSPRYLIVDPVMSIYVCAECRNYYEKKRQAMLQAAPGNQGRAGPAALLITATPGASRAPDHQAIQASVNRAQRKDTPSVHRQAHALPPNRANQGLMGPPPVPAGAVAHVPGRVSNGNSAMGGSQAIGYSQAHQSYASRRAQMAQQAYATSQKVMQFKYWVVRVVTAAAPTSQKVDKNGVVPVQGLREGDPLVPAEESTRNIADRARSLMLPLLIKATYHEDSQESFFQLHHAQQLTVRERSSWGNLDAMQSPVYFYAKCLVNATGKAAATGVQHFKTNKKPFDLDIVIPESLWLQYTGWARVRGMQVDDGLDADEAALMYPIEARRSSGDAPESVEADESYDAASSSAHRRNLGRGAGAARPGPAQPLFQGGSDADIGAGHPVPPVQGRNYEDLPPLPKSSESEEFPSAIEVPAKRDRSASMSHPSTPPPAKKSTSSRRGYVSPDESVMRRALKQGGMGPSPSAGPSSPDKQHYVCEVYVIPSCTMTEVFQATFFSCKGLTPLTANVVVHISPLGYGSFKTAHAGTITYTDTDPAQSRPQQVCLKRPYNRNIAKPSSAKLKDRFPRYPTTRERELVCREATLLMWANALLDMVYRWMESYIDKEESGRRADFVYPQFQFVTGAVLNVIPNGENADRPSTQKLPVFLAEPLLGENTFEKYVHNGDPTPALLPTDDGYEGAQFLCFTQHVQYWKTRGMAYISDYQGVGHTLSDPQLMTHPELRRQGEDMFGGGNVEDAFRDFPKDHICNRFCRQFSLPAVEECTLEAQRMRKPGKRVDNLMEAIAGPAAASSAGKSRVGSLMKGASKDVQGAGGHGNTVGLKEGSGAHKGTGTQDEAIVIR